MNNGDDFEDDLDPLDEGLDESEGQVDEDWDSYEEQPGDDSVSEEDGQDETDDAPAPKKKSGGLTKIIIGVVVLAVAGVAVMQLGKGTPAPAPVKALAPAAAPAASEPAGLLGSPQEMAKIQEEMNKHAASSAQPETPAPAPAAVTPAPAIQAQPVAALPVQNAPEAAAPAMPAAAPSVQTPTTTAPAEVSGTPHMPKVQDVMLKSPSALTDATPAPAPVTAPAVDTSGLNAKIDTILSRLGSLETDVSALKGKADQSAQINALKNTVESLQKKIDSQPAEKQTSAPKVVVKKEKPVDVPAETESKSPPKILGSAEENTEASPAATVRVKQAQAAAPKSVQVSTKWALKGAQPGQAMVAKAGESDIKTVVVGDSLAGIGKITAISYQDGRWSVIGTQGRINQ